MSLKVPLKRNLYNKEKNNNKELWPFLGFTGQLMVVCYLKGSNRNHFVIGKHLSKGFFKGSLGNKA